eukprot:m.39245 g.39245  ORF g.39245 m.39245 type:complete len:87 (-) comp7933_c0_seq1:640-900(-)
MKAVKYGVPTLSGGSDISLFISKQTRFLWVAGPDYDLVLTSCCPLRDMDLSNTSSSHIENENILDTPQTCNMRDFGTRKKGLFRCP